MKFIGTLIKKDYISPAIGRLIETFLLGTAVTLVIGILDNTQVILNGGSVDWTLFFSTFATTTASAIVIALKKHLRDIQKSLSSK